MREFSNVACLLALCAIPSAMAEPRKPVSDKSDPERIICRSETSTGSRLNQTKQCMKAREWAEQKQVNQQEVERIQANRWKSDN